MLRNVKITNFLCFGADSNDIEMQALNVILGRNGAGKSSFLDAIELLRCAPDEKAFAKVIQRIEEPSDWLYKGKDEVKPATLAFTLMNLDEGTNLEYPELLYSFSLMVEGQELVISQESLVGLGKESLVFYDSNKGNPLLRRGNALVEAGEDKPGLGQTCLSYYADPKRYPVITSLARELRKTKIYRDWSFSHEDSIRKPALIGTPDTHEDCLKEECLKEDYLKEECLKEDCLKEDYLKEDYLKEDCSNLPLILEKLVAAGLAPVLLEHINHFYCDTADFFVQRENGNAQIFLRERCLEGGVSHLSDGIFHFLAVLCILFNPDLPPIVCIEEPELGLHPNILPTIGRIMKEVLGPATENTDGTDEGIDEEGLEPTTECVDGRIEEEVPEPATECADERVTKEVPEPAAECLDRRITKEAPKPVAECTMIVTTYSTELVDSFTETPEDVLVCDKFGNGTQMKRLYMDTILLDDETTLGALWLSNSFGGNLRAY